MNEVDDQVDDIQWAEADGSDVDYDSDDLSDSDGSEGEVPVANDVKATDSSGKSLVGGAAAAIRANPKVSGPWSKKSSTIAIQGSKESSFTRGWKPVIDGKIQVGGEAEALRVRSASMPSSNGTSSSQKNSSSDMSSASAGAKGAVEPKKNGNESDSDVRRVPEMAGKGGPSGTSTTQAPGQPSMKRKRGGGSADKEHKRLKRLLRNRVSAQQARERKKAYLSDLEVKAKDQTLKIEHMEEKINTLTNENNMLRQLLKTSGHVKKVGNAPVADM